MKRLIRTLSPVMPRKTETVVLPESEVLKAVLNFFELDPNVRVWRRNVGASKTPDGRFLRFGAAGQSDIYGIIREMKCPCCGTVTRTGVHLEIECKKAGGRLSPAQKEYLETVRQFGGITLLAEPKPDRFDPTGLNNLRRTLRTVETELCCHCSESRIGID